MKAFHIQLIIAIACLMLSVSSFAYDSDWHVVENLTTHACMRVPGIHPAEGWRDVGQFDSFHSASGWIASHHAICPGGAVFG
jgi:hypothetical protein